MNLQLDFLFASALVVTLGVLTNCAGYPPEEKSKSGDGSSTPEDILRMQYVRRPVLEIELEFGPPTRRFDMGAAEIAFQWDKIAIAGALMCRLSAIVDTSESGTPSEWVVKRLRPMATPADWPSSRQMDRRSWV